MSRYDETASSFVHDKIGSSWEDTMLESIQWEDEFTRKCLQGTDVSTNCRACLSRMGASEGVSGKDMKRPREISTQNKKGPEKQNRVAKRV